MDAKTAVVTGSNKGIGRAIALMLAREGHTVTLNYHRDAASGQDALNSIREYSPDSQLVQADVTTPEGARQLMESAMTRFGRIDVLVNNVGCFLVKSVFDTTIEEWDEVIRSNLSSAFYCIKSVLAQMREQKSGQIVNIGSINAENARGAPTTAAYNASKTALVVLTKSVARSEARYGVRCNIVNPGFINTYATSDADRREMPTLIPLGSLGTEEDIAGAVEFLLSEKARYITGAVINVHGGLWV